MTVRHKEQEALSMIKSRRFTPKQIAAKTGVSLTWIDLKARAAGYVGAL